MSREAAALGNVMARVIDRCVRKYAAASVAAMLALASFAAHSTDEPVGADAPQTAGLKPEWQFQWRGWDGLYFKLARATPLAAEIPVVGHAQVQTEGYIGGRFELDGAGFPNASSSLTGFSDGVELRRAQIIVRGTHYASWPIGFHLELAYVPSTITVNKLYLEIPAGQYLGTLKLGQFQPPMGMQLVASSWDISLMEPAAPLQAIAPATRIGLQVGKPMLQQRATWALGVFTNGIGGSEYGSNNSSPGSVVGRATWLAIDNSAASAGDRARLLHLGASFNEQFATTDSLQYRSRPESHIAPYAIDTGNISSPQSLTLGGEAAWVEGPLNVQAELMYSSVSESGAGHLHFGGGYAMAGWLLTGESRPYDREIGAFGRLRPRRDFKLGPDGGWGAFEIVARYSHTDLTDGDVNGGRLTMLMTGFNWYLSPDVSCMLNAGAGRSRGPVENGDFLVLQARLGVRF